MSSNEEAPPDFEVEGYRVVQGTSIHTRQPATGDPNLPIKVEIVVHANTAWVKQFYEWHHQHRAETARKKREAEEALRDGRLLPPAAPRLGPWRSE